MRNWMKFSALSFVAFLAFSSVGYADDTGTVPVAGLCECDDDCAAVNGYDAACVDGICAASRGAQPKK